ALTSADLAPQPPVITPLILRHPTTTLFPYTTLFRSRYEGPHKLPGEVGAEFRSKGPMAPPGAYQVRLTAEGKSSTVPLELTVDPDRKSTRLNSSHQIMSYAVFCLKKITASPHQRCAR